MLRITFACIEVKDCTHARHATRDLCRKVIETGTKERVSVRSICRHMRKTLIRLELIRNIVTQGLSGLMTAMS